VTLVLVTGTSVGGLPVRSGRARSPLAAGPLERHTVDPGDDLAVGSHAEDLVLGKGSCEARMVPVRKRVMQHELWPCAVIDLSLDDFLKAMRAVRKEK
jgi:hypothetical protein